MAINPGSIGSTPIQDNYKVVIEMLTSRPTYGLPLADGIARTPGQIVGFYNGTTQTVELFCIGNNGLTAIKIG